jgi:hypothetical protein
MDIIESREFSLSHYEYCKYPLSSNIYDLGCHEGIAKTLNSPWHMQYSLEENCVFSTSLCD